MQQALDSVPASEANKDHLKILKSTIGRWSSLLEGVCLMRQKEIKIISQLDPKVVSPPYSPETLELAKKAAEQKGWLERATPEEKKAWVEKLARDFAAAGEAEYKVLREEGITKMPSEEKRKEQLQKDIEDGKVGHMEHDSGKNLHYLAVCTFVYMLLDSDARMQEVSRALECAQGVIKDKNTEITTANVAAAKLAKILVDEFLCESLV